MNNNMPNNMGNGMPNDPMANAANEQLVGGQSAVGNGPSVMQGVPGVQNPAGPMQGVANAVNTPGVMQGVPGMEPTPQAPIEMPGQSHSGINSFTMQKEEVKPAEPGVVDIPNFGAATPEPPVQMPNPVDSVVNNPVPNPSIDNTMQMPPMPEPAPVQPEVDVAGPAVNPALSGAMNVEAPVQDNVIGEPVNPNPMGVMDNPVPNPQGPSVVMQTPPTPQNNVIGNVGEFDNQIGDNSIGNNNVAPTPQNTMTTGDNDVTEMSDLPEKKFPLSTREMILVGIALIGIVAVVIMYWPK